MAKNDLNQPKKRKLRIFRLVLLVAIASGILAGVLAWPQMQPRLAALGLEFTPIQAAEAPAQRSAIAQAEATVAPSPSASPTLSSTPTEMPASETPAPTNPASTTLAEGAAWATAFSPLESGLLVAAYNENGTSRLFAFHPQGEPFTRLTYGPWDDIAPDLDPDGTRLAFASNRDGAWDLYALELASGEVTRLTETTTYEGSPSWSPDGRWLAYEAYIGAEQPDLEIFIRPLDGSQDPFQLTDNTDADYQPAWSPGGRQIAFVSDRSGENEIWLADLDKFEFTNLSRDNTAIEDHPAWSPDGSQLAWTSMNAAGMHNLMVWDANQPLEPARLLASGNWPAWGPNGRAIATGYASPNQVYLTGFASSNGGLALAPYPIPGELNGLTWGNGWLPNPLPASLERAAGQQPVSLWLPALSPGGDIPGGRRAIVQVPDIEAPYGLMQDMVDEAFQALRKRVAQAAGWDLLSNLGKCLCPADGPAATRDGRRLAVHRTGICLQYRADQRRLAGGGARKTTALRLTGECISKPASRMAARDCR
jgi:TolB protein